MAVRFLILLIFCPVFGLLAQTFAPVEGALVQQEVQFGLANECFVHFRKSAPADTLRLKWRRLEVSKPADWDIDLCDYGSCYAGIPTSGLMAVLQDTAEAYLKLIVQPGTSPGAAWLWFRVFDNQDLSNFQDVFFSLRTPGISSENEAPGAGALLAFPNPATDALHLQNTSATTQTARLLDSFGRLIFEKNIAPGEHETLLTGDYPAGVFWLQTGGQIHKIMLHPRR